MRGAHSSHDGAGVGEMAMMAFWKIMPPKGEILREPTGDSCLERIVVAGGGNVN